MRTQTLPTVDLEARIAHRKRQLIEEIIEHKKNCSRAIAAPAIDRAKDRLSELAYIVKKGVVDGWANVGPHARHQLDEWMTK